MIQADFYFHGALKDLLQNKGRADWVRLRFSPHQTVKHLVESLRVPHTEIGLILVNGIHVDGSARLKDGDRVEVYPSGDLTTTQMDRASSTNPASDLMAGEEIRFLLDNHLGKLATYLRMLGFDTWYRNDYQDQELAELAASSQRILLTRDRGLLMRKQVVRGCCVRSLDPKEQLGEALVRFDLVESIVPFKRCLRCNHPLASVSKDDIQERLLPLTRQYYQEFFKCPQCDQLYWKGSHYEHMQAFIERLKKG